uniref:Secreted protein n=1 Tax=Cacopsylla melanoneura TaxID=428564 RepID=A0A8D8RJP4_9HEMI
MPSTLGRGLVMCLWVSWTTSMSQLCSLHMSARISSLAGVSPSMLIETSVNGLEKGRFSGNIFGNCAFLWFKPVMKDWLLIINNQRSRCARLQMNKISIWFGKAIFVEAPSFVPHLTTEAGNKGTYPAR